MHAGAGPTVDLARCAACHKGQGYVDALMAALSNYVCNDCAVGEVDRPVETADYAELDSSMLLNLAGRIEALHGDIADRQRRIVGILRERHVSWARIGEHLGVTRQAVWYRFDKASGGE